MAMHHALLKLMSMGWNCRAEKLSEELSELAVQASGSLDDEYVAGSATGAPSSAQKSAAASVSIAVLTRAFVSVRAASDCVTVGHATCCFPAKSPQMCQLQGSHRVGWRGAGLGVAAALRRLRLYVEADAAGGQLHLSPRELTRWARATSRCALWGFRVGVYGPVFVSAWCLAKARRPAGESLLPT